MIMKKLLIPVTIIAAFALGMMSCDVIDDPLKDGGVINPPSNDTVYRNVLIEDFTGHRCKNCPKASKAIEQITDLYGDRVVAIGIHSGPSEFTAPLAPDYPTDFRTADGDAIASFFGGVPAQPIGMVSRIDYTGTGISHFKLYNSWAGEAAALVDQLAIAKIEATGSVSGSNVETDATVTFIGDQNGTYKVAIYLVENDIVAPQLLPDDTRDANYVHHNVLRKAITQPMGDALASGAISDSTSFDVNYTTALDASWNTSNLKVICVVIDDSNQEIMQVISEDVL